MLLFWKKKKDPPVSPKHEEAKKRAVEKNDEAVRRFKEALDRLGPAKDVSDLLGG